MNFRRRSRFSRFCRNPPIHHSSAIEAIRDECSPSIKRERALLKRSLESIDALRIAVRLRVSNLLLDRIALCIAAACLASLRASNFPIQHGKTLNLYNWPWPLADNRQAAWENGR